VVVLRAPVQVVRRGLRDPGPSLVQLLRNINWPCSTITPLRGNVGRNTFFRSGGFSARFPSADRRRPDTIQNSGSFQFPFVATDFISLTLAIAPETSALPSINTHGVTTRRKGAA